MTSPEPPRKTHFFPYCPPDFTLTQLLEEVEEDQEQGESLVRLAESCLMPSSSVTTPCRTRWSALRLRTRVSIGYLFGSVRVRSWARVTLRFMSQGEAVYTVPSVWLHISESDQQILQALEQGTQSKDNWKHQELGEDLNKCRALHAYPT